jgi:hypothetical protein
MTFLLEAIYTNKKYFALMSLITVGLTNLYFFILLYKMDQINLKRDLELHFLMDQINNSSEGLDFETTKGDLFYLESFQVRMIKEIQFKVQQFEYDVQIIQNLIDDQLKTKSNLTKPS